MDKGGGGGKTLIHKMWIKVLFFLNPSLTSYIIMPFQRSGSFIVQENTGILPAWRSGAGLDYIREASTVLLRLMILYGRSEPTQGRQNRSRPYFSFFLLHFPPAL